MVRCLFIVTFILIVVSSVLSQNNIVLQQGLNGYTGCEDTYFHFHSNDTSTQNINHGSDQDLFIKDCFA